MACTFSLTPIAVSVDNKGTNDLNPLSTTPPIKVVLDAQWGCGWSVINPSGAFWTSTTGIVGDGPLTFYISVQKNTDFQPRMDAVIFVPLGQSAPVFQLPITQSGTGPFLPGWWPVYIWNPLWWLGGPPPPPFNPGIAVDPATIQIILARLIADLASQLTDAAAAAEIERMAAKVAKEEWTRLKNLAAAP